SEFTVHAEDGAEGELADRAGVGVGAFVHGSRGGSRGRSCGHRSGDRSGSWGRGGSRRRCWSCCRGGNGSRHRCGSRSHGRFRSKSKWTGSRSRGRDGRRRTRERRGGLGRGIKGRWAGSLRRCERRASFHRRNLTGSGATLGELHRTTGLDRQTGRMVILHRGKW
ncbi:MAG: hypothetical protein EOP83_18870, partial [Verrucomicrobiaceae bacterium]